MVLTLIFHVYISGVVAGVYQERLVYHVPGTRYCCTGYHAAYDVPVELFWICLTWMSRAPTEPAKMTPGATPPEWNCEGRLVSLLIPQGSLYFRPELYLVCAIMLSYYIDSKIHLDITTTNTTTTSSIY